MELHPSFLAALERYERTYHAAMDEYERWWLLQRGRADYMRATGRIFWLFN